ncbi:MAG: NusG domain II-containing protein [Treponema sp.]|nr:NusG domain II-containing protein [Treponema sp.]
MKGLRFFDFLIIAVALGATVFISLAILGRSGDRLVVRIDGQSGQWEYPLDQDREVRVPGPLGITVVDIAGGRAAITDSPCPNKTCVLAGSISRGGQWVACLPNKVFVRLVGGDGEGFDAAAY